MAFVKKEETNTIEIDLTGPQGNAFYLMGVAKSLCGQLGIASTPVLEEMRSGDYNNLLKVFDEYFGSYVTMYHDGEIG